MPFVSESALKIDQHFVMRHVSRDFPTSLLISGAILLMIPILAAAQQKSTSNAKLSQAEAAGERIVRRFHQTLDFNSIFVQEFVTAPKLRAQATSLDNSDQPDRLDVPSRERLYVAMMTFLHLWMDSMLVEKEGQRPQELRDMEDKSDIWKADPPRTIPEVNQSIEKMERVSAAYRKYLPASSFKSAAYLENIKEERERPKRSVPRVENGSERFGIPKDVPVYVVRPEGFDYYFVEENGAMKLFYVDIFPGGIHW